MPYDISNMVEVTLNDSEDFLKIKETLTRMGISSRKTKTLFQSCHILHKQGKYYIVHFKELFALDGKSTEFSESDKARRNTIVNLLSEWNLVKIANPDMIKDMLPLSQLKVISHNEKSEWNLVTKYDIGKKKVNYD